MTEKLTKFRAPVEPPVTTTRVVSAPVHQQRAPERLALVVGPAIGFALAGLLAISLAIALAGGAGRAAIGAGSFRQPTRTAIFVL